MIRRRKRMSLLVPTSSMGDIAFLLIIFFILAGNFMKDNAKMEKPVSPDIEEQDMPQITVTVDEAGELWLMGINIMISELSAGVQLAVGDHKDRPVFVKIHKTIERRDFLPVLEALSEAGVKGMLAGDRGEPNQI